MSYSFQVRATSKTEASAKVAEKLAEVVASQPIHAADQAPAQAVADAFIALLRDDESQDVLVSLNGSCWSADGAGMNQASMTVSASIASRE